MPFGYCGKILHVNLSDRSTFVETPDEYFYRTYIGGGALGAYYLLKGMKGGTDPLGPENIIVFATGVLTGAPASGFCRYSVITKSPETGLFLDSQAGGFWGPELKFAGFDAVVVKGKADKPVYLWINNGKVEIRDAAHIWGQVTGDAQETIRKELNEPKARMVMIGPGGENQVKYACILNELKSANGRGGSGAVMGSKNLKAIVCRGTEKIEFKDKDTIIKHAKWFVQNFMDNPSCSATHDFGTAAYVTRQLEWEELPTHNFRDGSIENGENLSGTSMAQSILIKPESCYACAAGCKRVVKAEAPYVVDPKYGGPEYETLAALGSNCELVNLVAVAKANEQCNKYSLDTISTGASIAFAMECYENGLLTLADTDGLELKFGDADLVLELIDRIAYRKGNLGNLLAEGVKRAAEIIGKGADKYAIHTKGMEIAMHDPRVKGTVAIGYAASPIGGDHVVVEHDTDFDEYAPEIFLEQVKSLGILRRLNAHSVAPEKVRNFVYLQNHFSFIDCLTVCVNAFAPVRSFTMTMLTDIAQAITGWEISFWEIMKLGERRVNLAKVFNVREGSKRADDILPDRFYEKLKKVNLEDAVLDRAEFDQAIDLMYEMMNWDQEGKPRKGKLFELDVGWAIDEIY